jgi:hypothetical protein
MGKAKLLTGDEIVHLNDLVNRYRMVKTVVDGLERRENKKWPAFSKIKVFPRWALSELVGAPGVTTDGDLCVMECLSEECHASISNLIGNELKIEAGRLKKILKEHSVDV